MGVRLLLFQGQFLVETRSSPDQFRAETRSCPDQFLVETRSYPDQFRAEIRFSPDQFRAEIQLGRKNSFHPAPLAETRNGSVRSFASGSE